MNTEPEVFETRYGKFSASATTDLRSYERFKRNLYPQSKDIEFLKHFFTPESIVLDIGAHIGTLTIPFAAKAKKVYSFEPTPTTRSYLEKNIALNNLQNVTVFPFALGSKDADIFIHVTSDLDAGQNTLSEKDGIPVAVRRLDDLVQKADAIKIDVEGFECEVFEGGRKLLTTQHPAIFSEINFGQLWSHNSSPAKVEALLRSMGYDIYLPLGETKSNLSLITGLIFPAFFVRKYRNVALDILAIQTSAIPSTIKILSPFETILWTLAHKTTLNIKEHLENIGRRFGMKID